MNAESFILDNWSEKEYSRLVKYLRKEAEDEYRQFSEKLIPDCKNILGVRIPKLRALAKYISKGNWREYIKICKNNTFEEIVLKGAVISLVQVNFEEFLKLVKEYVPLVDNWAICDYFCSGLKQIKKYKKEFLPEIIGFLESENPWIKRVGLVLLKVGYVDEEYVSEVLTLAEKTICEHYYVQMAHAWLVAECYTKFPQITHSYLEKCKLNGEILNKAVQKIRDSYRVNNEWKEKVVTFRRKN